MIPLLYLFTDHFFVSVQLQCTAQLERHRKAVATNEFIHTNSFVAPGFCCLSGCEMPCNFKYFW